MRKLGYAIGVFSVVNVVQVQAEPPTPDESLMHRCTEAVKARTGAGAAASVDANVIAEYERALAEATRTGVVGEVNWVEKWGGVTAPVTVNDLRAAIAERRKWLDQEVEQDRKRVQEWAAICVERTKAEAAQKREAARNDALTQIRTAAVAQHVALEVWSAEICWLRQEISEARDDMAQERSGARISGYVDKSTLYEAGQTISVNNKRIAELQRSIRATKKQQPLACSSKRLSLLDECISNVGASRAAVETMLEEGFPSKEELFAAVPQPSEEERTSVNEAPARVEACLAGSAVAMADR